MTEETNDIPNEYRTIQSTAKRGERGRPSGGVILAIRSHIPFRVTTQSELIIAVTVELTEPFLFAGVYLNPSHDISHQLNLIADATTIPGLDRVLVMGDLNCRIGSCEDILPDILHLSSRRKSQDKITNQRGRALLKELDRRQLIVLNGRFESDPQGCHTFMSKQGCSLVDLVISSVAMSFSCVDAGATNISSPSDHVPIMAFISTDDRIYLDEVDDPTQMPLRFRWNEDRKVVFNAQLRNRLALGEQYIVNALRETAQDLEMLRRVSHPMKQNSKPWFNTMCVYLKKCSRHSLREWQRSCWDCDLVNYLFIKRNFSLVCDDAKRTFFRKISDQLINSGTTTEFWQVVRRLLPNRPPPNNALEISTVHTHFANLFNIYQISSAPLLPHLSTNVTELDCPFTLLEMDTVLLNCKAGKAPGADGLPYEFYFNLNVGNRTQLLFELNSVFSKEEVPHSWSELRMTLIFKKGNRSLPENYRGITLMNCITKIFTALLTNRIYLWAENNGLLPECQAAFRRERGCTDNLFITQSIIHEHIRIPRNRLYCTLVDYRQAFDCINHYLLWTKLGFMGMSRKIICILSSFYSNAVVRVSCNNELTEQINVQNGVLQGDCLSPLLFILYLSDFEKFLKEEGVSGVGVGPYLEIRCLYYADDLNLFSANITQAIKAVKALEKFCEIWKLKVNVSKTKLLIFNKSEGPTPPRPTISGRPLEIVQSYCYLGITFNSLGRYDLHISNISKSVQLCMFAFKRLFSQLEFYNHLWHLDLYKTKVISVMLYGAEIWGPWSCDQLEIVQSAYFKSFFELHATTPHYAIRVLLQVQNIRFLVIKKSLSWICKMLNMDIRRWPRKCLERMISRGGEVEFNWFTKITTTIRSLGIEIDLIATLENCRSHSALLKDIRDRLFGSDVQRCINSSHCRTVAEMIGRDIPLSSEDRLTFASAKLLYQLLLSNERFQALTWARSTMKFHPDRPCDICNRGAPDTIAHFISECPIFNWARRVVGITTTAMSDAPCTLTLPIDIKCVLTFIKTTWRARQFYKSL